MLTVGVGQIDVQCGGARDGLASRRGQGGNQVVHPFAGWCPACCPRRRGGVARPRFAMDRLTVGGHIHGLDTAVTVDNATHVNRLQAGKDLCRWRQDAAKTSQRVTE